jgi:hypothetical protein
MRSPSGSANISDDARATWSPVIHGVEPAGSLCLTHSTWLRNDPFGSLVKTRALVVTLFLAGLLLVPAQVRAGKPGSGSACRLPASDLCTDYVTRGRLWASMPIPYYVNLTGAPVGALDDIQDSFNAWQNEVKSATLEADPRYAGDHSAVSFVFRGLTNLSGQHQDGMNTVYFADGAGGTASAGVWGSGKQVTGFDISVNTTRAWTTDLSCPTHTCGELDLQNVLTHEIGHVLDLYHVTDDADAELTMYPGAAPDEIKKRDLGAGEILAVRALYPPP